MMRSKDKIATAVRTLNGEILVKIEPYVSLSKRYSPLKLPMLRGVITFVEMLIIGIRTLNFSAEIAVDDAEKQEAAERGEEYVPREKKGNRIYITLTALIALAAGIFIFFFLPLAISNFLNVSRDCNFWYRAGCKSLAELPNLSILGSRCRNLAAV